MVWLAIGAVILALWCLKGGGTRLRLPRSGAALAGGVSDTEADSALVPTPRDYTGWLLGLSALIVTLAFPTVGLWAVCAAVVLAVARWLWRRSVTERQRIQTRDQMVRGCGVLAGQLAIGELPATAIRAAASEAELFVPVAAALEIGSSPIAAFRLAAARSGCEALHQLADGWQVCIRTGMPLGETVQAVVANVERELERETTREAELASARTTGRMLAALPLVGFLMGYAVDADPLEFITGSGFGQWCLLGACCLAGAGLIWTEKLAAPSRAPKPNARLGLLAARLALRSDLWDVWGLLGLSGASMPPGLRSATFESPSDQAAERVAFAPALELLAAVVSTGAPLRSATATVGQVVAGPLGRRLRELQALTDIGLSDAEAWRTLREHPLWGEVARQIAHGADSGAGLGVILRRAAVRHRNRVSADLLVQARQVGVKSALPLMTCYLPAFLLVGVLPIIGSLASGFLR